MKIAVCAGRVLNTNEVKIDPAKGTLTRNGIESILNPDDANVPGEALELKDTYKDATVTVISMRPSQAEVILQECLAMGTDEAILLSGREFGSSDTWATSNAISAAIKKIGDYDIVFDGHQAIDGDTVQARPQISEKLDIPQVTCVQDFGLENDTAVVRRQMKDRCEVICIETPYFLTAVRELSKPRYITMKGIYEAYEKEITVWGFNDVDITQDKMGLKASPTRVFHSFIPEPRGAGVALGGSPEEQVAVLMDSLKEEHII